jgi:hypothetical protein
MSLTEIAGHAFNVDGTLARWRRMAIAGAVCALCAALALYQAIAAAGVALEPYVGLLGARLILAGFFAIVAVAAILVVKTSGKKRLPPAESSGPTPRSLKIGMIIEAIMLGYSLSRKTRN